MISRPDYVVVCSFCDIMMKMLPVRVDTSPGKICAQDNIRRMGETEQSLSQGSLYMDNLDSTDATSI